MAVFAIPSSISFLDTLATHILENHHVPHDLLALRRVQILLPTRRSWRKFQEALKKQAHSPFLFPQGQAITSSQEETAGDLSRTLRFFAFLQDFFQKRTIPFSPQALLSSLPALLALLEESILYECPTKTKAPPVISDREELFCALREAFLKEASCRALFGNIQTLENVQRLIRQIHSSSSPKNPVILAGVTALFPQMRTLFQLIAQEPQNNIVLPGLILLSTQQQAVLEPTHPQYALYQILQTISCPLEKVVFLGEVPLREKQNVYPIALALLPLEGAPTAPLPPEGTLIEARHPQEEAHLIAVLLREVLETPGKTAALVTMDTELTHNVVQHLRRWHLTADISQGPPWAQTREGSLALLCAEALEEAFSPLSLLALLKHPLSAVSREIIGALERKLRAGISPTLLEEPPYLRDLFACLPSEGADTAQYVQCHERLFRAVLTPEFQEEVPFFSFLKRLPHLSLSRTGYRRFFSQLLQMSRCYRPESSSARLFIWGPLEARLLSADRLILGGLNEDVWTQALNPWLSPQERQHLGLLFWEQRQGLLAQELVAAFGAPEVFLTRTCWKEGTPTSPVPWLRQWEGAFGSLAPWRTKAKAYSVFTEDLYRQEGVSCSLRPCPCPPVSMRPKELPVTQIAVLLRNPYAIYARYILGLKPIDPISEELAPLLRGQYLHTVLDDMVHHLPKEEEGADFVTQLLQIRFPVPEALLYWLPRLETVLTYCLKRFLADRAEGIRSYTEIRGSLTFPDLSFTLTGVADRIDLLPTGAVRIIDYKTGALPSAEERRLGLAPQLPLEAAIAQFGAFPPLGPVSVDSLSFWHLRGDSSTQIEVALEDPASLAQEAYTGVRHLIAAYQDPARGYPASPLENLAPVHDAYRHLARVKGGR